MQGDRQMENQPKEQRPRPHFWMWGDAVTVRNPIREQWETKQQEKARKNLEKFLKEKQSVEIGKCQSRK
jgi:Mlc titration factor MtfA (ptsG expression regulator)